MSRYRVECIFLSVLACACALVTAATGHPFTAAACAFWAGVFAGRAGL